MKTKVFARGEIKKKPVAAKEHRISLSRPSKDTVRLTFAPRPEYGDPELMDLDNKKTDKGQYRKTRGDIPGPDQAYQSKIRILCYDDEEYAVVFLGRSHHAGAGDDDAEVFVTTPPPGSDDG